MGVLEPGSAKEKPTFLATDASLSFAELFSKYLPSVEMLSADEKYIFRGVPAIPDDGLQPENVKENDFLFLIIGPTVVPASVTEIGDKATVKSALLPPLMVHVVSVIAPPKEITPPAELSAAMAFIAVVATIRANRVVYFFIRIVPLYIKCHIALRSTI